MSDHISRESAIHEAEGPLYLQCTYTVYQALCSADILTYNVMYIWTTVSVANIPHLRNSSEGLAEVTQLGVVPWKNILLKLIDYLSSLKVQQDSREFNCNKISISTCNKSGCV